MLEEAIAMTTTQPDSLQIPINREQRRRFERAAPLILSPPDGLAFAQAIVAPPEPSPAFLDAARAHHRRVEER